MWTGDPICRGEQHQVVRCLDAPHVRVKLGSAGNCTADGLGSLMQSAGVVTHPPRPHPTGPAQWMRAMSDARSPLSFGFALIRAHKALTAARALKVGWQYRHNTNWEPCYPELWKRVRCLIETGRRSVRFVAPQLQAVSEHKGSRFSGKRGNLTAHQAALDAANALAFRYSPNGDGHCELTTDEVLNAIEQEMYLEYRNAVRHFCPLYVAVAPPPAIQTAPNPNGREGSIPPPNKGITNPVPPQERTNLAGRVSHAGEQYLYGARALVNEGHDQPTDQEVYDWLKGEEVKLLKFDTWSRYLRDFRIATDQSKYGKRAGYTGRSAISVSELDSPRRSGV